MKKQVKRKKYLADITWLNGGIYTVTIGVSILLQILI